MAIASVGKSSFGDLKGVEQFIEARAAAQVNSLIYEFSQTSMAKTRKVKLSVNEGNRSRARQLMFRNAWVAYVNRGKRPPVAALAAPCYTSTHDVINVGNATDLGITMADGSNRAMLPDERAWVVGWGKRRGILPTGESFSTPELWHFNTYPDRATIAPITHFPTPAKPVAPKPITTYQEGPDMLIIQNPSQGRGTLLLREGKATSLSAGELAEVRKLKDAYGKPLVPVYPIANDAQFDIFKSVFTR